MSKITEDQMFVEIEKTLRHISGIIKQKGREILSNYTITPPQFVALQWLAEHGDMTIGDLSNKMYLACSTTTDLVDRMEKNSLVERVRDKKDRRIVRIHLLKEGERIIHEVISKRQDYLRQVMINYPTSDIESIKKSLDVLYIQMNKDMNKS